MTDPHAASQAVQMGFLFVPPASPEEAFARVFRRLGIRRSVPAFQVEYRPFAGLRSTIQVKDAQARVRLSDILQEAPVIVLEALAEILLAQVYRRRASREARECYLAFTFKPEIRRRIEEARRQRGRKQLLAARGEHFDLEEIFVRLNQRFFRGELSRVRLGWSAKQARSILGHYDAAHRTITLSRWLDSPRTPRYLVEYVVFHEMLHILCPTQRGGQRRVVHSRQFRAAEKQLPRYEQARRRLKHICA